MLVGGAGAAGPFLPDVIAAASPMVGQLLGLAAAGEPSNEPERCSSVGEALPAPLGARPSPRLTRRFTVNTGWFGGAPLMRAHSSPTVAPIEPLEAPLPDERANERATLEGR